MEIDKMRPELLHKQILLVREKCGVSFFLENSDAFVIVACPGCQEVDNFVLDFYKYGFKHVRCAECNTVFVNPRPTEESLMAYYSDYEAPRKWTEILIKTNSERKIKQHQPRVELMMEVLKTVNTETKTFVDLGAGNGNFARLVQDHKVFEKVVALDISKDCVEACNRQGLDTFYGGVDEIQNNSVNALSMNDLLEHLFDPLAHLKVCHEKLKNNGFIMIATPNGEGFDFKLLQDKTENVTPPEHIQYLNPYSIKMLLEQAGFYTLRIMTPGILDVEIIKRSLKDNNLFLQGNNRWLDYIFSLDNIELMRSFQSFLSNNLLSSHMLAFAIKKG